MIRETPTVDVPSHSDPTQTPVVSVRLLRAGVRMPSYQTEFAAGMDLEARPEDSQPVLIPPGAIRMIGCGFAMALPPGFEAQVRPRSGLASRYGVTLPNAPGTIDADYRGEVKVPLINLGPEPFTVELGMRIAQMVIAPVFRAQMLEAETLDSTERGSGGFGSTGL